MFSQSNPIRVAILDDHPLVHKALQFSIENEPDMQLVAMCKARDEIASFLEDSKVDLLVLDYLLAEDEFDGLRLVKHFRIHYPTLKILISSAIESPAVVNMVMKAGVLGFVGKSKEQEELIFAIRMVAAAKRYLSNDMQNELLRFTEPEKEMQKYITPREMSENHNVDLLLNDLTPRELEVVRCYLSGLSISQISAKFNRSRKTISGQKQNALRKLGLKTDVELFRFKDLVEGVA